MLKFLKTMQFMSYVISISTENTNYNCQRIKFDYIWFKKYKIDKYLQKKMNYDLTKILPFVTLFSYY